MQKDQAPKKTIYLGIDPGTRITGYGVISLEEGTFKALDFGCVRPPPKLPLPDRYLILFESVTHLIEKYKPIALAIETQYVSKNPASALKLGMARGAITVAARKQEVLVIEYSPSEAKRAISGNGNASKEQIQKMVKQILSLDEMPTPEDAADALSLALCYALRTHRHSDNNLKKEELYVRAH